MKIFAERLRELHHRTGQSQQAAVDMIKMRTGHDIHQTSFSDYLHDRKEPGISATVAIAKAYGVSVDWLTGLTDDREPAALLYKRLTDMTFAQDVEDAARLLAAMPEAQRRVHIASIEADAEERRRNERRWQLIMESVRAAGVNLDLDGPVPIISRDETVKKPVRIAQTLFELA